MNIARPRSCSIRTRNWGTSSIGLATINKPQRGTALAIESAPDDATFRIFLGAILATQGRFTEAEEAHRTALACSKGCIDEAYLNLGFAPVPANASPKPPTASAKPFASTPITVPPVVLSAMLKGASALSGASCHIEDSDSPHHPPQLPSIIARAASASSLTTSAAPAFRAAAMFST